MKILSLLRCGFRFCYFVGQRFIEDGCSYRAAALAFTTLLSLVPLLTVSFTLLAAFPSFKTFITQAQSFIFNNFVATSGELIQSYLEQFVIQASHLSIIGLVFLLFTAIMMLYTIEQALNTIWRASSSRQGILALVLYWAILTLAPLLIGLGLTTRSYFLSLHWLIHSAETLGISTLFLAIAPFLLASIGFSVLYIVVPNCKVPIKNGIIGGVIAAFLFQIAKLGFSLYITLFPTYELLYGALAAVPIFLIWIYLSWLIILLGAEISYALTVTDPAFEKVVTP